jgi:small-conductance mechanosensitive channel
MDNLRNLLDSRLWGNSVSGYLSAFGIAVVGLVVLRFLKKIAMPKLEAIAKRTSIEFDDFIVQRIEKTLFPLFYVGAVYVGLLYLHFSDPVAKVIKVLWVVAFAFFGFQFAFAILNYFLEKYWVRPENGEGQVRTIRVIVNLCKLLALGVIMIVLLDNMGIKVSALLAGVGIGGIAIALAAQALLGDLFSFFVITFDKPFEIGDFIIIGDHMGTVEAVGIKTTRIRSIGGEQIILSNTDLTNSRVKNFKRMEKRRIQFKIGVTYQTSVEQLRELPKVIEDAVKQSKDTSFERAHFSELGDSSLIFEAAYYILSGDYNKYMDIQQAINLRLIEEFAKRKVEFAYPTRTLFVNGIRNTSNENNTHN